MGGRSHALLERLGVMGAFGLTSLLVVRMRTVGVLLHKGSATANDGRRRRGEVVEQVVGAQEHP